jgi:hypothetical protein
VENTNNWNLGIWEAGNLRNWEQESGIWESGKLGILETGSRNLESGNLVTWKLKLGISMLNSLTSKIPDPRFQDSKIPSFQDSNS